MMMKKPEANMLAPDELVKVARENAEAGLWDACLENCSKGIDLGDEVEIDNWVSLRLGFAAAVLGLEEKPEMLIERAIEEVRRVTVSDRLSLNDTRRGSAYRYLGGLYAGRSTGHRPSNLTSVADSYSKAAAIFREEKHPEDWALLKLSTAGILQKRVRELGVAFLSSSSQETNEAIESMEWSIECCEDAKRVYQRESRQDLYDEADDLVRSARGVIETLRSNR